jgi:hypothetical protein
MDKTSVQRIKDGRSVTYKAVFDLRSCFALNKKFRLICRFVRTAPNPNSMITNIGNYGILKFVKPSDNY